MITSSESAQDIKTRTKNFLFRFVRKRNIEDSDDFFASGMVNSLFAMQLVLFVEKEFGIKVQSEDLDLKNFRTVDAISGFVEKKRALG
jgi:acyl carrier protein